MFSVVKAPMAIYSAICGNKTLLSLAGRSFRLEERLLRTRQECIPPVFWATTVALHLACPVAVQMPSLGRFIVLLNLLFIFLVVTVTVLLLDPRN